MDVDQSWSKLKISLIFRLVRFWKKLRFFASFAQRYSRFLRRLEEFVISNLNELCSIFRLSILWNINRSTHLYFLSLKIASRYSRYSHHLDSLKRNRKLDVFYSHLNYFFIKIRITRELFVSRRDKRLELNRSRLKIVLYFNFEKENTFHNRTIIHLYPDSTFRSSF